MTWTWEFRPYPGKQTVGDFVLAWNEGQPDEFTFPCSCNMDMADDVKKCCVMAKESLAKSQQQATPKIDPAIVTLIEGELSK